MSKEKSSSDPDETDEVVIKSSKNQTRSPCEKRLEEKHSKHSTDKEHFAVYQHYGQHAVPTRETWVQYNVFGYFSNETPDEGYKPETRNSFLLIVFFIVFLCILITVVFNFIVNLTPSLLEFFQTKQAYHLSIGCTILLFVVSLAVSYFDFTYYPPANYFVLLISVVCLCVMTAFATAKSETQLIIYAILSTMAVVGFLMCLACSSWDFTKYWTVVMVAALAVVAATAMCYVGMAATKTKIKPLLIGLTIVGTIVQSVVLLLVLQSILGGKSVEMSEQLYIIAAYEVYTSIVVIFLKILRLFNYFS